MPDSSSQTLTLPKSSGSASGSRLSSLDIFRGATVAAMAVVNNPGTWDSVYPQLRHSHWHGWTFTDMVFPFFLWIVGVAMTLSFAKRIEQGGDRRILLLHTIRRGLIIYACGVLLTILTLFSHGVLGKVPIGAWRGGTLQGIATAYVFGAAIYLFTSRRGQVIWLIGLLGVYWALMTLVPIPGHVAGVIEPDTNFDHYFRQLTGGWLPIGITTLPAIGTVLFGALTGHLLRAKLTPAEKTTWMLVGGNILLFAGLVMNVWLPINKPLWTSSYSTLMAGLAMIVFGACYWLVDVQGYRRGTKPFAILGMNALVIYALSELNIIVFRVIKVDQATPPTSLEVYTYQHFFAPVASPENASLLWALFFCFLLYLVAYAMYRKKWFVKA